MRILACLLWLLFALQGRGQHPSPPQEVPLELEVPGGEAPVLIALLEGAKLYLPVREFLEALGISTAQTPEGSWCGWVGERRYRFCLDPDRRRAETWRGLLDLAPFGSWIRKAEEVFAPTAALEALLEARIQLDTARLRLHFIPLGPQPPVFLRAQAAGLQERELNWTAVLPQQEAARSIPRLLLYPGVTQYTVSWGRFATGSSHLQISWRTRMLLAGGELDLEGILYGSYGAVIEPVLSGWQWRWIGTNPWMRQLTIGQTSVFWIPGAQLRGLHLRNEPPYPEQNRGWVTEERLWPPGTLVELYQNRVLVGRIRVPDDGRLLLRIPLLVGHNELELRAITPTGTQIEERWRRTIPYQLVPFRALRYELWAGERLSGSERLLGGRVAFGLLPDLTLQAGGVQSWTPDGAPLSRAYWGALGAGLGAYGALQAEVLWPFRYLISLQVNSSRGGNLSLLAQRDLRSWPYPTRLEQRYASLLASFPFRLGRVNLSPRAAASYMHFSQQGYVLASPGLFISLPGLSGQFFYQERRRWPLSGGPFGRSLEGQVFLHAFRSLQLSGQVRYNVSERTVESWRLQLGFSMLRSGQIYAYLGRLPGTRTWQAGLQLALPLGSIARLWAQAQNNASTLRQWNHMQMSLSGSFAWMPGSGIWLGESVGGGGFRIEGFQDENSNGRRDRDEALVDDLQIQLRLHGQQVRSDPLIKGLAPYTVYRIEAVSPGLPHYRPSGDTALVPLPEVLLPVRIPFQPTAILQGQVWLERDGRRRTLPGLIVHVRRLEGDFQQTVTTFHDGYLYLEGLPRGTYELKPDAEQLSWLGIRDPEPIRFQLNPAERELLTVDVVLQDLQRPENRPLAASEQEGQPRRELEVEPFVIQLGSFRTPEAARRHQESIRMYWPGRLYVVPRPEVGLYVVWTDTLWSRQELEAGLRTLRDHALEAFGIRLERAQMVYGFSVALGAFRRLESARALAERAGRALGVRCAVDIRPQKGLYVVLTEPLPERQQAEHLLEKARSGIGISTAYLIPVGMGSWQPLYRSVQ
jgi:hypothetical protein